MTIFSRRPSNIWSRLWFVIPDAIIKNCLIAFSCCSIFIRPNAVLSSVCHSLIFSVSNPKLCTRTQLKASSIASTFCKITIISPEKPVNILRLFFRFEVYALSKPNNVTKSYNKKFVFEYLPKYRWRYSWFAIRHSFCLDIILISQKKRILIFPKFDRLHFSRDLRKIIFYKFCSFRYTYDGMFKIVIKSLCK